MDKACVGWVDVRINKLAKTRSVSVFLNDDIIDKVTNYSRELDFDPTVIGKIYSFLIEVYIQFEKRKFLNP